jgi:hypothetical protein
MLEKDTENNSKETSNFSFIRLVASVRLYVYLSVIIAAVLIIGTLLPQDEMIASEQGGGFVLPEAAEIYHSWWFAALFVLLALNVLGCTLERLMQHRYRLGSVLSHVGLVVVLLGGALSAVTAQRGSIGLHVGESADSYVDNGNHPLGFTIQLNSFAVEKFPPAPGVLVVCRQDGKCSRYPAQLGKEYNVAEIKCKIKVLRSFIDLRIDAQTKEPVDVSDQPNNPALLVEINKDSGTKKAWLFANYPQMNMNNEVDGQLVLSYEYKGAGAHISDFRSGISIIENGKVILAKTIRVNDPLRYGGYSFYQAQYHPEDLNWTGLSVVKDPGIPVVYLGFCVIIVGLILAFYIKPSHAFST